MIYTVSSTQNTAIKAIKKLSSARSRKSSGLFLVEGEKCVREVMGIEGLCTQLIVLEQEKQEYSDLLEHYSGDVFFVSEPVLESISTVKSPQGIIAVCKDSKLNLAEADGLVIILDGISDPGNLGTIIRTADAVGAARVLTLDESADYLSPKVVRASMGSVFHIPVKKVDMAELLSLKEAGYMLLGADLAGETDFEVEQKNIGLVIGSEAHGISENVKGLLDKKIKLRMFGQAESLNAAVAAGILMYKIVEM
ncbi:MAG: RNA methyltransferase [Eubacteriales bacterium]